MFSTIDIRSFTTTTSFQQTVTALCGLHNQISTPSLPQLPHCNTLNHFYLPKKKFFVTSYQIL